MSVCVVFAKSTQRPSVGLASVILLLLVGGWGVGSTAPDFVEPKAFVLVRKPHSFVNTTAQQPVCENGVGVAGAKVVSCRWFRATRAEHLQRRVVPQSQILSVLRKSNSEYIPLFGDLATIGEYFAVVSVGTPPISFTVQTDTGSVLTAVPSSSCVVADHGRTPACPNSLYNTASSSSYSLLKCPSCPNRKCTDDVCPFTVQYGDQSKIQGILGQDTVTIGSLTVKNANVGAIQTETTPSGSPFMHGNVDGIFGLAYFEASLVSGEPVIDLMVRQHGFKNIFALGVGSESGTANGEFVVGGYNSSRFVGDIAWAKISQKTLYHVELKGFYINGIHVQSQQTPPPLIVDSGTTEIILDDGFREPIKTALQNRCNDPSFVAPLGLCDGTFTTGSCYALTEDDLSRYPNITIRLGGYKQYSWISLNLLPKNYMTLYGNSLRCFTIAFIDINVMILGDTFTTGFYTVYDRENARIGFGSVQPGNTIVQHKPWIVFIDSLTPFQNAVVVVAVVCVGLSIFVGGISRILRAVENKRRSRFHRLAANTQSNYGSIA